MATIPSNKRQRTAEQSLHISNLPDGILSHVASYLASPSKALFAVAMTSPSKSWTKDNFSIVGSKQTAASILQSEQCDVLDFEDIEKSLAVKLTDDDLHTILKCINAQDVLKKLRLTGCINITGRGLQVLRGSSIVEYIDLSLVNHHESPAINDPMLSEETVLPILESVIDTADNSLQFIMLPKIWRAKGSDMICQFLNKFDALLATRQLRCSYCNSTPENMSSLGWVCKDKDETFGLQNFRCHKCTACFCYDCDDFSEVYGGGPLNYCKICEREYCHNCVIERSSCTICDDIVCSQCSRMNECVACETTFCQECCKKEVCSSCDLVLYKNEALCSNCVDVTAVPMCWDCNEKA